MRISIDWLKEFVNIDETPEVLADILSNTGLEAEVTDFPLEIPGVIIGKVESTVKHPDDKSGKSTVEISRITTTNNGVVAVKFFNWSNKVEWKKHIRVTINTNEVNKWQNNNYGAK